MCGAGGWVVRWIGARLSVFDVLILADRHRRFNVRLYESKARLNYIHIHVYICKNKFAGVTYTKKNVHVGNAVERNVNLRKFACDFLAL